jgi:hypothetical protein
MQQPPLDWLDVKPTVIVPHSYDNAAVLHDLSISRQTGPRDRRR